MVGCSEIDFDDKLLVHNHTFLVGGYTITQHFRTFSELVD